MTEQEWLACTDPTPMLAFLRGKASDRKLRLFAVACCWQLGYLLRDKRSKKAIKASERYADGLFALARITTVRDGAGQAVAEWVDAEAVAVGRRFPEELAYAATQSAAHEAAAQASDIAARLSEAEAREIGYASRKQSQVRVLRDIFGNPFRPSPPLPPAVLAWNDRTVPRIAEGIYDDRKMPEGTLYNDRLAILADALLDAGCEDEALIQHCRSAGPHVRGCWAIDLILGKS